MQQTIIVQEGDSLTDLAVLYYGSVETVVSLANDNNLSITGTLMPGQKLVINPENVIKPLTVKQLKLWLDR